MITDKEIKELAEKYIHTYYDCGDIAAYIAGFKFA